MTDGSGFIGSSAARLLWHHLTEAEPSVYSAEKDVPSLFQVRCFTQHGGFKGTLVVREDIDVNEIHLRESMKKLPPSSRFTTTQGHPTGAKPTIDVVGVSNAPRPAHLNRQLALVLSALGVDPKFTVGLASTAVADVLNLLADPHHAQQYLRGDAGNNSPDVLEHLCYTMIAAGHSVTTEPYLRRRLEVIARHRIKRWKAKLQIPFPGAAFMYGAPDPTGTLKPNEIYIKSTGVSGSSSSSSSPFGGCGSSMYRNGRTPTADDGPFEGPVLVTRAPSCHPGDVQPFTAVDSADLQAALGSSFGNHVIFFSTQGSVENHESLSCRESARGHFEL